MWRLLGHEAVLKQIDRSFREGRYAHAYLVVGPAQVGKRTLALGMAQAVNCLSEAEAPCGECIQCRRISSGQHADVVVLGIQSGRGDGPARREIGIGDVREVQRQASLKPYEGRHRVFIFDGAEHMSEEAANALLKTLEEPPPQVMLILLTAQEEVLLSTIRSRCRRVELRPLGHVEVARGLVTSHSVAEEEAEKLARLSRGRLGRALLILGDPSIREKQKEDLERVAQLSTGSLEDRFSYASELSTLFFRDRERAREMIYLWLQWWRDLLLIKEGAEDFVHNVEWAETLRASASEVSTAQVVAFIRATLKTLEALDDNANARLALEVMMLSLPMSRL